MNRRRRKKTTTPPTGVETQEPVCVGRLCTEVAANTKDIVSDTGPRELELYALLSVERTLEDLRDDCRHLGCSQNSCRCRRRRRAATLARR